MASDGRHGERNRLLLALSGAEYERLLPSLEALSIPAGRVLHQTHQAITAVYFPQRCVVSMFMAGDDGESVEVQTVGNEGIVGLGAFLGDRTGFARTVARVPDHAMKMSVVAFRRAVRGTPSLRRILFQYTQTVLATLSRTSLCHRLHRLEARCAHSLLTTQDRVGADRFEETGSVQLVVPGDRERGVLAVGGDRHPLVLHRIPGCLHEGPVRLFGPGGPERASTVFTRHVSQQVRRVARVPCGRLCSR